jgi:hypothetical protein
MPYSEVSKPSKLTVSLRMMMIAELFFIVDLLTKRQLMDPVKTTISQPVVYDPDYDYRLLENQPKPIKERMVIDLDPATVSAFEERERVKKLLRG